jgi:hypothetical protein
MDELDDLIVEGWMIRCNGPERGRGLKSAALETMLAVAYKVAKAMTPKVHKGLVEGM